MKLESITPKLVEKVQDVRFRATVRCLLSHVPAYREFFLKNNIDFFRIRKIDDWQKYNLPLITKLYYLKNPESFVVKVKKDAFDVYKEYQYFLKQGYWKYVWKGFLARTSLKNELKEFFQPHIPFFSGGTESGVPTPVFLTVQETKLLAKSIGTVAGLWIQKFMHEEKTVGMNLFPYGPHLAWHAVHTAFSNHVDFNIGTAAGGAMRTQQLVLLASKFQANIFAGMADYFKNRFLPELVKQKLKLPKRILFVNGATKMHVIERRQIEDLAKKAGVRNCIILDLYGASEFKESLLPECTQDSGFHQVDPFSTALRVVQTHSSAKNGLIYKWEFAQSYGLMTVFNLDGAGTLLEGYLLGDIVSITNKKCHHCKLQVPKVLSVDRLKHVSAQLALTGMVEAKVKGARVNLSALRERILKIPGVKEVQLVVKKNQCIINVVGDKNKTFLNIKQEISKEEFTPVLKYTTIEYLYSGKYKFNPIIIESQ
ncbi:hypothetical protein HYV79_02785 [Candidatus Woesearchaeota archaeon]|nr:hypothetical protein [Candidatus Woesearchaeota archaeon]